MSEEQLKDRIAELELAVKTLNDLWTKECHRVTELEKAYLDVAFQLAKYKAKDKQNSKQTQPTPPKIDPWLYEAKQCSRCSMDFDMITGYVCPRPYCPTFLKIT